MKKSIQVTRSSMPGIEEYIEEIKELWESRWLTNMGVKHRQFEAELERYLDTTNVALFANGHLALECAMAVFGLKGEVITTPFTFPSTTHAIVRCGLTPVFCDINPEDYTLNTEKIEGLITSKTSAIMPVHVYGNICNTKEIEKIAKKHGLLVIYDAAHSFGIKLNGKGVANYGDASVFSFHATKVFHTIEGGAVAFKDGKLKQKFADIKNFGFRGPESVEYIGGNAKMNEFQAAMGICNLRHIAKEIAKRKIVAEAYVSKLTDISGIKLFRTQEGVNANYGYFPVVFDGFKLSRDAVFERLEEKNIHARKYFYPLTSNLKCYEGRFDVEKTPVAKYISDRILTMPIYPDLALEDVNKICDAILED